MILICDLDGTLVDSFADIRYGVAAALREIGVEPGEELLGLCRRGIGLELFYQRATDRIPDGPEFSRFVAAYRDSYPSHGRAYAGVAETLDELRRRLPDLVCAVATTKRTDTARRVIQECGLSRFLDVVRGSDGLPHKPDPAILRDIARRTRRTLDRAVVVGDTDRDVLAARAAGCTAVAVTYGGWTRQELEAMPVDLAPHHLIDCFEELVQLMTAAA